MTSFADKIRRQVGAKPAPIRTFAQNSKTGKRNREKGKEFERVVADAMKIVFNHHPTYFKAYPLEVRRSSQAERAYEADVIIESPAAPQWLLDMWIECENAKDPKTEDKMAQAIHDAAQATLRTSRQRTPVVVWRPFNTRTIWLSTYASWLDELLGAADSARHPGHGLLVTAKLEDVLLRMRARL